MGDPFSPICPTLTHIVPFTTIYSKKQGNVCLEEDASDREAGLKETSGCLIDS